MKHSFLKNLPTTTGVYLFKNKQGKIIYIGKAVNLNNRLQSYFGQFSLGPKTQKLVAEIERVKTIITDSELEAIILEANLINLFKPKYNARLRNGKTYPYIQITKQDIYPAVLISHQKKDKNSLYFGPYQSVDSIRQVLRILRKIFPFVSVRNHPKKICFYHHLRLCPCPAVFDSTELKASYRFHINNLILCLSGNKKRVLADLTKKLNKLAAQEEFEQAQQIKEAIDKINHFTSYSNNLAKSLSNANLKSDLKLNEMNQLKAVIRLKFPHFNRLPRRIEGFDISNLSGTNAVGAMIVFINGSAEKSLYRRFKIRKNNRIDDVAQLAEIVRRRLKHQEWPLPDLILIDGGKGQVNKVYNLLKNEYFLPVLGLAKRNEEIVFPLSKKTLKLPTDSGALHLLQRCRDEAHRFANQYHRLRRRKMMV